MIFQKVELNTELLLGKPFHEQFEQLRQFIYKKYKVDFISVFKIDEKDSYKFYIGDSQVSEDFAKSLNIETPQIKFNNNILLDSKERGIRARFAIPLTFATTRVLIILESKKCDILKGKEKLIYQDIYNFKNAVQDSN